MENEQTNGYESTNTQKAEKILNFGWENTKSNIETLKKALRTKRLALGYSLKPLDTLGTKIPNQI